MTSRPGLAWSRGLFGVATVLGLLGCETNVPEIVDLSTHATGADLSGWDLDVVLDLARSEDLAPHIVPLPAPSGLSARYERSQTGAEVAVRWRRGAPAARVRVLRRAVDVPTGPFDPLATVLYEGASDEARHAVRQLVALETFYYAAFACDDAGGCESAGVQIPFAVTLMEALQGGGYTIYLRHATDGVCADALALGTALSTSSPGWWASCASDCAVATASQLSPDGVAAAIALGDVLRARAVPITRVRSSEQCRAATTTSLLALGPMIERDPDLTYYAYDESRRCATSKARIAAAPLFGNTLLVGHAGFATPCGPLSALGYLDAAVFRPSTTPGEKPRFMRLVNPAEWPLLF